MADRGRDVSHELTEVRTVLSRAESAMDRLEYLATVDRSQYGDHYGPVDPELSEMVTALEGVSDLLCRWRKTGRPKR